MKTVLLTFVFLFSSLSFANTSTPRDSFKTFLKAMVKIKENTSESQTYYNMALSTLDLREVRSSVKFTIGKKRANQLIKVLDKIKRIDYQKIPEKISEPVWSFDKRIFENQTLEIKLIQIDQKWLFSSETLNQLDLYQSALASSHNAKGVIKFNQFAEKIRSSLPPSLLKKSLLFENWQWLGILFILFISFLVSKICQFFISMTLNHSSKIAMLTSNQKLAATINPLSRIIFIFTTMKLIEFLDFGVETISFLQRLLYITMSIMTVWLAHKVIEFFTEYFSSKAETTDTKFDDILVPLMAKTAFVITYILGALLVANSLTIDVSGIIAGLGIGGLAFAFAAKDTLANFFGSIMLVLDRPFDIGDVITSGDIEGVVVEVGFRSTRIRTFNDSLITISNGELMNRPIDNKGKRRFRRLVTTLGVEYDTTPAQIEAFCEGIRQLIINYKWTRKDNFHVYFNNYGASSLDIKLVVYWKTEDYSRELAEKHRLLIDILRLSKELDVGFAFPTQTVHLFNEEKNIQTTDVDKYLQDGREKATTVLNKPLSLKNPRSNSEDKEQFGDNEIGIK